MLAVCWTRSRQPQTLGSNSFTQEENCKPRISRITSRMVRATATATATTPGFEDLRAISQRRGGLIKTISRTFCRSLTCLGGPAVVAQEICKLVSLNTIESTMKSPHLTVSTSIATVTLRLPHGMLSTSVMDNCQCPLRFCCLLPDTRYSCAAHSRHSSISHSSRGLQRQRPLYGMVNVAEVDPASQTRLAWCLPKELLSCWKRTVSYFWVRVRGQSHSSFTHPRH